MLAESGKGLTSMSPTSKFSKAMALYILPGRNTCQSLVTATHPERTTPPSWRTSPEDVGTSSSGDEDRDAAAVNCLSNMDDMVRYSTYPMFNSLHSIFLDVNFYLKAGNGRSWYKTLQGRAASPRVPESARIPGSSFQGYMAVCFKTECR